MSNQQPQSTTTIFLPFPLPSPIFRRLYRRNSCCQTKRTNAGYVYGPAVYIMDEHQPLVPPSESCVRPQHFTDRPVRSRRTIERHQRGWLFYHATSRASEAGRGGPCASERTPVGSRGACSEPPSRHGVLVLELRQAREKVSEQPQQRDVIDTCWKLENHEDRGGKSI